MSVNAEIASWFVKPATAICAFGDWASWPARIMSANAIELAVEIDRSAYLDTQNEWLAVDPCCAGRGERDRVGTARAGERRASQGALPVALVGEDHSRRQHVRLRQGWNSTRAVKVVQYTTGGIDEIPGDAAEGN
jgi:hypothetical protein